MNIIKKPGIFFNLVLVALSATLTIFAKSPPSRIPSDSVHYLDQNWSGEERRTYYRTSQGSALLSYDIFVNMEQAGNEDLFRSDENIIKYGLVPQPADPKWNPDGLPIGWTKTSISEGRWKGEWAGISCAACHNGQLEYKGTKLRIDGGFNGTFDLHAFVNGIDDAMRATLNDEEKFERLADRLGTYDEGDRDALRERLSKEAGRVHLIARIYMQTPSAVGPGRMDALTIVHNQIVANELGFPENWRAGDAPVKWPFLWNAPQSAWIGWRGTQQFPLFRNAGESMGIWVKSNLTAQTPEEGLFDSTIDLEGQIAIEKLLRKLAPPSWPEDILGKIDRAKASKGAELFAQNCAECHSTWPHRWSEPKKAGKRFIENALVPVDILGTDATQVQNILYGLNPIFFTGSLAPYLPLPYQGATLAPGMELLGAAVSGATQKALSKLHLSEERLEDVSGYRYESEKLPPNGLYKASPREGTWAIAPYLHNGSVPNLYELLIPAKERSKKFFIGREFDPVKVGVDTTGKSGKFLFDTSLVGNSNSGHSFEDGPRGSGVLGRRLSEEERWALIEYLKSIPSRPGQAAPFGGPKDPIAAWQDKTFYHVKHKGGYQGIEE